MYPVLYAATTEAQVSATILVWHQKMRECLLVEFRSVRHALFPAVMKESSIAACHRRRTVNTVDWTRFSIMVAGTMRRRIPVVTCLDKRAGAAATVAERKDASVM